MSHKKPGILAYIKKLRGDNPRRFRTGLSLLTGILAVGVLIGALRTFPEGDKADLYRKAEDYDSLARLLLHKLTLAPADHAIHRQLLSLVIEHGAEMESGLLDSIHTRYATDPEFARHPEIAPYARGAFLEADGDSFGAIGQYQDAAQREVPFTGAWNALGRIYGEKVSDWGNSGQSYRRELARNPEDGTALRGAIEAALRTGDRAFLEGIDGSAGFRALGPWQKARYYLRLGRFADFAATYPSTILEGIDIPSLFLALLMMMSWILLINQIDIYRRQPIVPQVIALLCGMISIHPILEVVLMMTDELSTGIEVLDKFLLMCGYVGPREEAVKLAMFLPALFLFTRPYKPVDPLIFGAMVGLGFATVENAGYLSEYSLLLGAYRFPTSCLGHMSMTAILSCVAYRVKVGESKPRHMIIAYVACALGHGLYNSFLSVLPIVAFAVDFLLARIFIVLILYALKTYRGKPAKSRTTTENLGNAFLLALLVNTALVFSFSCIEIGPAYTFRLVSAAVFFLSVLAFLLRRTFSLNLSKVRRLDRWIIRNLTGVAFDSEVAQLLTYFTHGDFPRYSEYLLMTYRDMDERYLRREFSNASYDRFFRYSLARVLEKRALEGWLGKKPDALRMLEAKASPAPRPEDILECYKQFFKKTRAGDQRAYALMRMTAIHARIGKPRSAAACLASAWKTCPRDSVLFPVLVDRIARMGPGSDGLPNLEAPDLKPLNRLQVRIIRSVVAKDARAFLDAFEEVLERQPILLYPNAPGKLCRIYGNLVGRDRDAAFREMIGSIEPA